MKPTLALLLILCAGPAGAGPAKGWVKQGSSLLYYDSSGTLSGELPLGRWEERDVRGGVSKDGNFAWTWEARKLLLRYFGPSGKELWSASNAAAPETGDPAALSADGRTVLFCRKSASGLSVVLKSFVGNTLWEAGPFPILHAVELTDNGLYALLRWTQPDEASMHTFLAVAERARKDVASAELRGGRAVLGEDGAVRSGGKVLFFLAPPTSQP